MKAIKTQESSDENPLETILGEWQNVGLEQELKDSRYYRLISRVQQLIHREIPAEGRRMILRMIGRHPDIKMVVLETRPEFVTREKIKEIKELLGEKHVELAMGLEVKDDFIRAVSVNKGLSRRQFEAAAGIITSTLALRTYVLLKPPFLTEKESIRYAVETIDYAFELGSNTVSLEPCTVQDYTLVKYLNNYSPLPGKTRGNERRVP